MRHPDEGAIQGWLEGQLPAGEAREVATHVEGCAECGALAAEIRGLMARTSGIVAALDGAEARPGPVVSRGEARPGPVRSMGEASSPVGSMPAESLPGGSMRGGRVPGAGRQRVAWRRWAPALAAAVVVVAVMRQASSDEEGKERVREALRGEMGASAPAVVPAPVQPPMPAPVQPPLPAPAPDAAPLPEAARAPAFAADAAAPVSPPTAAPAAAQVAQRAVAQEAAKVAAPAPTAAREWRAGAAPSLLPPAAVPVPPVPAEQVAVGSGGAGAESSRAGMAGGTTGAVARGVAANAAGRARGEDAALNARRSAPASVPYDRDITATATECYHVISSYLSQLILAPGGEATIVADDSSAGRWTSDGDSVRVRWGDSLAVFPAGSAQATGRFEVRGESRPLTVRRGCPER